MSLIDGIIDLAAAKAMAPVQTAIAVKVLKTANAQGQAALQLIQSATQAVQDSIEQTAENLTGGIDIYA